MTNEGLALLNGWELEIPWWGYLVSCALIVVAIRAIHCLLKASSMRLGEGNQPSDFSYWKHWRTAFNGFKNKEVADLWLGVIIGLFEIVSYQY